MNTVYSQKGNPLPLGPAIGKGGEGEVCPLLNYKDRLAKIYSNNSWEEEKIRHLCTKSEAFKQSKPYLYNHVSFPRSLLFDDKMKPIGFGMNRVNCDCSLIDVYAYKPSAPIFSFNGREKVEIAIKICELLKGLHDSEICFGDFHPGNILVKKNGEVFFVDADTMQFEKNGKLYKCKSCFPGYASPETMRAVKGYNYATCPKVVFTENSDNWALAIHIYKLLFNGAGPYSVNIQNANSSVSAAYTTDNARVENGITPFNGGRQADWVPDVSSFPDYINSLFSRAFVKGHANPGVRPKPEEWKSALMRYKSELRLCKNDSSHYYWNKNAKCPYCEAEQLSAKTSPQYLPAIPANPVIPPKKMNPPTVYNNSTAPSVAAARAYHSKKDNLDYFKLWLISLTSGGLIQFLLYLFLKKSDLSFIIHDYNIFVIVILIIGGIFGLCMYNLKWSAYVNSGSVKWYDYLLSNLCVFGGTVAVILALAGVALGVAIVLTILAVILVIFVIAISLEIIKAFASG